MRQQDLVNYFNGTLDSENADYTALGQDASYHFDFHHGSTDDELCFELAVEILDKYVQ